MKYFCTLVYETFIFINNSSAKEKFCLWRSKYNIYIPTYFKKIYISVAA